MDRADPETTKQKLPAFIRLRRLKAAKDKLFGKRTLNNDPLSEELDSIFSQVKDKRKQTQARIEAASKASSQSRSRRFTEDGLPIYTTEELRMDNPNAGNTPLCPFDCDCCF